ncbi:MAG: alpha/beta hydrolase [Pseudomonas sp.]|uniref:alpha/beta hydrolase n=1 Tax=Pseudomonas sp. TaxID=306 RepID=UPI00339A2D74
MIRPLLWLMAVLLVLYLCLCAGLWAFQRQLIYFPQPRSLGDTDHLMTLVVDDTLLRVTVRPHAGPKALIYFGGNAEDVSLNLPAFSRAFPDHALYLLHYRGFGGSAGAPSEEANQRDAQALFDQVRGEHPDILVVGRSLGSGVAVRLASQRPATGLVLVTPYNSLEEIAAGQFPWLPVSWLLQDKYLSWQYAASIRVPTLLIAASEDRIIPRASTERLLSQFAAPVASLAVVEGADHNDLSQYPRYLELLGSLPARR